MKFASMLAGDVDKAYSENREQPYFNSLYTLVYSDNILSKHYAN
ncbi:MAG: hypothetical protein Q7U38_08800 [Methylobacter sp.]|nr:hypothetical protein [Methylobacter sp.]MDZ4218814.1 hypothetical protein [Methylobacter sp.]